MGTDSPMQTKETTQDTIWALSAMILMNSKTTPLKIFLSSKICINMPVHKLQEANLAQIRKVEAHHSINRGVQMLSKCLAMGKMITTDFRWLVAANFDLLMMERQSLALKIHLQTK